MNEEIITRQNIENRIFTIRGLQVMIDSDLAEIYGVKTGILNQSVKRNIERFPKNFRFQLTDEEFKILRSQIGTSNGDENLRSQFVISSAEHGGRRHLPYAFTEQGVSMLASVLRSKTAIEVSIKIINAFVEMRKFLATNATIFQRLDRVEQKQLEGDRKFEKIFQALEEKDIRPNQGIFYDGQIFDAYVFVSDLVKSADKSIVLIDNYIDESVLSLLTKRKENVSVTIYTHRINNILRQDLNRHNEQYPYVEICIFTRSHDRFLIIDDKTVYHFGASLKDLGKKWFAFSKMKLDTKEIIGKLSDV